MNQTTRLAADPFVHDVFISYSRKDTPLAAALERALKRYRPPKDLPVPRRGLDVFRDEEDFTGTEYYGAVEKHLNGSRKLVILCSPHASQSPFVNDEIRRFARSHAAGDMIPVLVAGLPNNEVNPGDESSKAFPPALCEELELPLAIDYRGFNAQSNRPDSRSHRTAWYKLLADIYGCSRAEVEEREQKRRFRQRMLWGGTSAVVAAALGGALYVAVLQGERADEEARMKVSIEVAGQAMAVADKDPELSTLLGLEAANNSATAAATSALRVSLAKLPDLQVIVPPASFDAPTAVVFAPDMRQVAVASHQDKVQVLDLETGRAIFEIDNGDKPIQSLRFSPDGTFLAAVNAGGDSAVYGTATRQPVAKVEGDLHWRHPQTGSRALAVLLREADVQLVELDHSGNVHPLRSVTPGSYSRDQYEPYTGLLSPDGRSFAALEEDTGRITVTDLESGKALSRVLRSPVALWGLAWSPKGTYLGAYGLAGFVVLDARTLDSHLAMDAGETMFENISFSPDEKLLAGTDRNGSTSFWDLRKRQKVVILSGQETRAYKPRFSPRGDLLSVVYANGRAELFNLENQRTIAQLDTTWGDVLEAGFAPDGKTLVVEYEKGRLAFWNVERWHPQHRLPLEYNQLEDLEVSADDSAIGIQSAGGWRAWNVASGAEESGGRSGFRSLVEAALVQLGDRSLRHSGREAHLVESTSGRQILRFPHSDEVQSAELSPNGSCVVTASGYRMASGGAPADGNVIRLWDGTTGTLLQEWGADTFGADAAFFLGEEHVIVLYRGAGFVYRTELCGPRDTLMQLAKARVSRELTAEERALYVSSLRPR